MQGAVQSLYLLFLFNPKTTGNKTGDIHHNHCPNGGKGDGCQNGNGLNPELLTCDVTAFEQAVDAGKFAEATKLYSGELLRGFFLSNALEFEHWLDAERIRLAGRYADSLESLADAAAAAGDTRAAVECWQCLVRHDPFDSRYVAGLMEALERAGDPANALIYARKHRELLRAELDITLPTEIKVA